MSTFRLEPGISIAQPRPSTHAPVTLASPALAVMTDLAAVKAVTILPEQTLPQAERAMINQGVRMLFVVSDMPALEGLVTSTDLRGERQMRLVHERNLHFDEMRVADVMTPLAKLDAVDFAAMATATVSNLIATLQRFGRNHLLVSESAGDGARRVRGVISRAQIERQLGRPVQVTQIASSFSEIEQALL